MATDPPAAIAPSKLEFLTETAFPVCVNVPFHPVVMSWLPGNVQPSVQPLTAIVLPIVTLAVKPLPQSLGIT
jgi:hypothetical protein